jgi:hypothetical protein
MFTIVKGYRSWVNSDVPTQFHDATFPHTWLLAANNRRPTCLLTSPSDDEPVNPTVAE